MDFNSDLIRRYMTGTDVLAHGIDYYLCEDEKRTEEEATELAYAFALKYCRKWYRRDRKDPETRHRRAYDSFAQRVYDAQYFNSPRRQKAAEAEAEAKREAEAEETRRRHREEEKAQKEKLRQQQLENERKRIAALREKCVAKGLDFEKENIRQLKRQRFKQGLLTFIASLFYLPTILLIFASMLFFFIFRGMPMDIDLDWPYVAGILGALASWVPGFFIMRSERKWLPDEAFDPIRKKKKEPKKK